jgi:hypothetical protein
MIYIIACERQYEERHLDFVDSHEPIEIVNALIELINLDVDKSGEYYLMGCAESISWRSWSLDISIKLFELLGWPLDVQLPDFCASQPPEIAARIQVLWGFFKKNREEPHPSKCEPMETPQQKPDIYYKNLCRDNLDNQDCSNIECDRVDCPYKIEPV